MVSRDYTALSGMSVTNAPVLAPEAVTNCLPFQTTVIHISAVSRCGPTYLFPLGKFLKAALLGQNVRPLKWLGMNPPRAPAQRMSHRAASG